MLLTPGVVPAQVGSGKVVKVTGVAGRGRTATLLLRGSNKLVLEEAERSVHDALCVLRCLVHRRALVPGGAAPEMAVEHALAHWAKTLTVRARRTLHPSPSRCIAERSYLTLGAMTQASERTLQQCEDLKGPPPLFLRCQAALPGDLG